jgi:Polyketide cyclase / dehydrase and lipid transport
MASVQKEVTVDATAAQCWAALRDFGALHERLAKGFVTDTTMLGEREREVTFATGAVAREVLVGVDEKSMRLSYSVVDGPLGSSHHNASAQIVPVDARRCRFVWITDVLPDELAERTSVFMDAGLAAVKATLEAQAGSAAVTPAAVPHPGVPPAGGTGEDASLSRFVASYLDAWHEADPIARASAVERLWDEEGTLTNARAEYVGWAQVATALQRTFDAWVAGGHRFRTGRPLVCHHDMLCLPWEMTGPDSDTVVSAGTNVIKLSADARILSDWQFVDP